MAKKKAEKAPEKPTTQRVEMLRTVPATMLQASGETPDYRGANVATGSTRTLPADVASRLVKAGHAKAL